MTTTRPTCPSSGCGTSTCRRSRRRSTPAPTRSCARSTRSTACRAAATDYLMTDILKGEWGFDGFVESDWTAVAEMRACPPKTPDSRRVRSRRRRRRPERRGARSQRGHGLGDDQHAHPRLRASSCSPERPDLDGADQRRRAPDPARQVPRRAVRAPVRAVPAGPGRGADAQARRGRGRARRGGPLDGAAEERGQRPAARPGQEDRGHRPAGATNQHDMLGPWWGAGQRRGRRHRLRRDQRAEPRRDLRARAASSRTPSRRTTTRRAAAPTPASRPRSPPRRLPTRSCSRSARPAR